MCGDVVLTQVSSRSPTENWVSRENARAERRRLGTTWEEEKGKRDTGDEEVESLCVQHQKWIWNEVTVRRVEQNRHAQESILVY